MDRSAMGLLLLLVASSLVFTGIAGMSLFGPQTFTADDNGKNVTVNPGETFWIRLPENPTAGYAWDFKLSDGLTKLSDKYEPADRSGLKVGVGGTHSYEIKAVNNGSQAITAGYRQAANQSSESMETYSLNVNVVNGGPLSGILHLTLPVMAGGVAGLSEQPDSAVKMLIRPGDNGLIMPVLPPAIATQKFSIIQTGTSVPPLAADLNMRNPQEIQLSYTDVPSSDTINAKPGDTIHLALPENPSTGYSWQMTTSDGIGKVSDNYIQGNRGSPARPLVGAGGTHEWTFKVTKQGSQTIAGIYKRPWEGSSQGEKRFTLTVNAV
ncbi:MAG TPA: protease inhibitor I42 family protein [Methanocella sp.]|jgi:inhibitor of cysteine peptidase